MEEGSCERLEPDLHLSDLDNDSILDEKEDAPGIPGVLAALAAAGSRCAEVRFSHQQEQSERAPIEGLDEEDDNDISRQGDDSSATLFSRGSAVQQLEFSARAELACRSLQGKVPPALFTCCAKLCFLRVAMENSRGYLEISKLLEQVITLESSIQKAKSLYVPERGARDGSSRMTFVSHPRAACNGANDLSSATALEERRRKLCLEGIGFLLNGKSRSGVVLPRFCVKTVMCILGLGTVDLYRLSNSGDCLMTEAGGRSRVLRRIQSREGYPEIKDLRLAVCSCSVPCWSQDGITETYLSDVYARFSRLSREASPRKKEQQFILEFMFCPSSNSPTTICNLALSNLFTVGVRLIARLRAVLVKICSPEEIGDDEPGDDGIDDEGSNAADAIAGGAVVPDHGMIKHRFRVPPPNKTSLEIREALSSALEDVTRADPAPYKGRVTLRIYCPHVNSQRSLMELILAATPAHLRIEEEVGESTLMRELESILRARGCRLSFQKHDHNACVHCKTSEHAMLRMDFELKRDRKGGLETTLLEGQLAEEVELCNRHNSRDAAFRSRISALVELFRRRLNAERISEVPASTRFGSRRGHGLVVHQDDKSRVDVPRFFHSSSMDLTAFRYDINGQVNAVTGDAVVFSHGLGGGRKNGGSIMETVLLGLLMSGHGEEVLIIVSDCAAAGRNYVTTVAMTQYFVDHGFAKVCVAGFLENCHGKWLADILFGQYTTKARNLNVVSIDDVLSTFESIKRANGGSVRGYEINPLSCVDWERNLQHLGYETEPPAQLRWLERDPHWVVAAASNAASELDDEIACLLQGIVPTSPGMVRISSFTPDGTPDSSRLFFSRSIDVPARKLANNSKSLSHQFESLDMQVVRESQKFQESGEHVVSQKTAAKLGHNSANIARSGKAPELHPSTFLHHSLYPPDFLDEAMQDSNETCAATKTAPNNWLVREPLHRASRDSGANNQFNVKARYPARNFVNAVDGKPPRHTNDRIAVPTYPEPPFPLLEGTSCVGSSRALTAKIGDALEQSYSLLELVRQVQLELGISELCPGRDRWLQRGPLIPDNAAIEEFERLMHLTEQRMRGKPLQPKTAYLMYKSSESVKREAAAAVEALPIARRRAARTAWFKSSWAKMQHDRIALRPYIRMARVDIDRHTLEMAEFSKQLQKFDEENEIAATSLNRS